MGLFTKSQVAGAVTDVIVNRIQDAIVKAISTLEDRVRSLLEPAVAVVTGSFTMTDENVVDYIGTGVGNDIITLPRATSIAGLRSRPRVLVNNGRGFAIVAAAAGETVNGAASVQLLAGGIMLAVSDGASNWRTTLNQATRDIARGEGGANVNAYTFVSSSDTSRLAQAFTLAYTVDYTGRAVTGPIGGMVISASEKNLGTGSPVHIPFAVNVGGTVKFSVDRTGAISSALAQVANGGGAAPTLGTIGGSGPAAAAQSGWMQVTIGGNTRFIPVWA